MVFVVRRKNEREREGGKEGKGETEGRERKRVREINSIFILADFLYSLKINDESISRF